VRGLMHHHPRRDSRTTSARACNEGVCLQVGVERAEARPTLPHRRRDSPTSAPRLGTKHICARTSTLLHGIPCGTVERAKGHSPFAERSRGSRHIVLKAVVC
jgi:hypothetical protein